MVTPAEAIVAPERSRKMKFSSLLFVVYLSFPVCSKRKHAAAASQQLPRRPHFPPTDLRDQEPPQIYGAVDLRLTDLIRRIITECESVSDGGVDLLS